VLVATMARATMTDSEEPKRRARAATVCILGESGEKKRGVLVPSGFVLTCAHGTLTDAVPTRRCTKCGDDSTYAQRWFAQLTSHLIAQRKPDNPLVELVTAAGHPYEITAVEPWADIAGDRPVPC
jgi:hypothetical protein